MNKIPITIAAISQYTIPETILFEIPLLNCPKESAPVTNSRNRFMIPLPIVPKKVIQSLRKTGERIAANSVVVIPHIDQQGYMTMPEIMNSDFLYPTRFTASFHLMIQIIFCYRKNAVVRL